jgi:hypothetical protein
MDEDEIIRPMERLSRIEPTEDARHRAIERVRQVLIPNKRQIGLSSVRIFRAARIAASVGIVFVAISLLLWGRHAQGELSFGDVISAMNSYNGWICLTPETLPEAVQPKFGSRWTSWVTYAAPAEKKSAEVTQFTDGTLCVIWYSFGERITHAFDSRTGEVHISPLSENMGRQRSLAFGLPLGPDFRAVLSSLAEWSDSSAQKISQTSDGAYVRFDIHFEENGPGVGPLNELSVWVDPKTKLIQKWKTISSQTDLVFRFAYETSGIKDIYDIGVPRDARVIDDRPSPAVEALLDRLDKRVGPDEQFGNYVGVVTHSAVEKTEEPPRPMDIGLFSRDEDDWVSLKYWDAPSFAFGGWPKPDIVDVIAVLRDRPPNFFFVCDKARCEYGKFDQRTKSHLGRGQIRTEDERRQGVRLFSLSGSLWPGRHYFEYLRSPNVNLKLELLPDPESPGLVLLQGDVSQIRQLDSPDKPSRFEHVFRLDPSRDDLPVEKALRDYLPNGTLVRDIRTHYVSYDQLPNGRWYPTWWYEIATEYSDGKPVSSRKEEYYLQMAPDMQLDPVWFTNPAERFKDEP